MLFRHHVERNRTSSGGGTTSRYELRGEPIEPIEGDRLFAWEHYLAAAGFYIGAPHPYRDGQFCTELDCKDVRNVLTATLVYSRDSLDLFDREPRWTTGTHEEEVTVYHRYEGDERILIDNHAGTVLPQKLRLKFPKWTARRFFPEEPTWIQEFDNQTNSDSVTVRDTPCAKYTIKMLDFSIGEKQMHAPSGQEYVEGTIHVAYNPNQWRTEIPNKGRYELTEDFNFVTGQAIEGTVRRVHMINADGSYVTEDEWLDELGRRYRDGNGNLRTDLTEDEKIVFRDRLLPARPFAELLGA